MALIAIAKKHALSHPKAKAAAEKVATDLHERFDLEYEWNGDDIEFNRPGSPARSMSARTPSASTASSGSCCRS